MSPTVVRETLAAAKPVGKAEVHEHILLDLWVDDLQWLEKFEPMQVLLRAAVGEEALVVIQEHYHQFEPSGYTGYLLLAQSHISVHSWVEERLLTLDILACAPGASQRVADRLIERIQPRDFKRVPVWRGEDRRVVK